MQGFRLIPDLRYRAEVTKSNSIIQSFRLSSFSRTGPPHALALWLRRDWSMSTSISHLWRYVMGGVALRRKSPAPLDRTSSGSGNVPYCRRHGQPRPLPTRLPKVFAVYRIMSTRSTGHFTRTTVLTLSSFKDVYYGGSQSRKKPLLETCLVFSLTWLLIFR